MERKWRFIHLVPPMAHHVTHPITKKGLRLPVVQPKVKTRHFKGATLLAFGF
jgi:hypothetical protein